MSAIAWLAHTRARFQRAREIPGDVDRRLAHASDANLDDDDVDRTRASPTTLRAGASAPAPAPSPPTHPEADPERCKVQRHDHQQDERLATHDPLTLAARPASARRKLDKSPVSSDSCS
jgi:hypothetical protein